MPWLWVAARADRAGERMKVEQALNRATNSAHLQNYAGALSTLALEALPPEVTPLERAVAAIDVFSVSPYVAVFGLMSGV